MIITIHIEEREDGRVAFAVETPEIPGTPMEEATFDIFKEFMTEFYMKIGTPGSGSGFLNNSQN
jgi:hypothetical protein